MRTNERMKIRDVAGEHIVIQQGGGSADLTRVMALNGSALFLFNSLAGRDFTTDDAVRLLVGEYAVDEATARRDAEAWIADMQKYKLIV